MTSSRTSSALRNLVLGLGVLEDGGVALQPVMLPLSRDSCRDILTKCDDNGGFHSSVPYDISPFTDSLTDGTVLEVTYDPLPEVTDRRIAISFEQYLSLGKPLELTKEHIERLEAETR